ncbi:unnamed protein product [Symbiodinium necroappetens]|uniref:Uncharacterized protein n=1 Tax=Symbiodinium necroappetens TaxID=1628268 RepID=A0A812UN32_9DINO|nr:unnamed protein product [Symbiodinium necroappetens]
MPIVLSRPVTGKSTASINISTAKTLQDVAVVLIDLHGRLVRKNKLKPRAVAEQLESQLSVFRKACRQLQRSMSQYPILACEIG